MNVFLEVTEQQLYFWRVHLYTKYNVPHAKQRRQIYGVKEDRYMVSMVVNKYRKKTYFRFSFEAPSHLNTGTMSTTFESNCMHVLYSSLPITEIMICCSETA